MGKNILKLFVVFGIMTGIIIVPSIVEKSVAVSEPKLELPTVGTYDKLKSLVKKAEYKENDRYDYLGTKNDGFTTGGANVPFDVSPGVPEAMQSNSSPFGGIFNNAGNTADSLIQSSGDTEHSTTNVQVAGVDEADIIKNDGKYIYHLVRKDLIISEVYPSKEMKIVSKVHFEKGFVPQELYIMEDKVIVIGSDNSYYRDLGRSEYSKVIIYDSKDKSNLKVEKEVTFNGRYNSSRRIGNSMYLIGQKYISSYDFEDDERKVTPCYTEKYLNNEKTTQVDFNDIRYFPGKVHSKYIITIGIDLSDLSKEAQISTYLGDAGSIYSSKDNMYVTFTERNNRPTVYNKTMIQELIDSNHVADENTTIYRFKLNNGSMECMANGEVPGHILNQFSMDENNGYFRIATTKGSLFSTDENISKNNMYVLNSDLEIVGKIEDIAPGEKIYSVRYMGDRAYMVTFRKVDPLFVIDLSNPTNPKILGKLKIPGYSDYLHPYDENHIIGFGKETIAVSGDEAGWGWQNENGEAAYYQGFKLAMFDVTDPTNPIEMWKEEIGDRGTESPLLNNHKALLFSKDKNILAFPISVAKINGKRKSAWSYGDVDFVGAYVYEITLDKGFKLKAKLTDLTEEDYKKMGYGYYGNKKIDRIIYIGDTLYTISNYGYSAYDMDDYDKLNTLEIK